MNNIVFQSGCNAQCCRALVDHIGGRKNHTKLVWVDVGANIDIMDEVDKHVPIIEFKGVYIMDACEAVCATTRERVAKRGWTNVEVVCADAADITVSGIPGRFRADMVTFSYSSSNILSFYKAVDNMRDILATDGLMCATEDHSYLTHKFVTSVYNM